MHTLLNLLALAALIGMCIAFWKPGFPPFKSGSRLKSAGFYLVAALAFYVMAGSSAPETDESGAPEPFAAAESGVPLAWKETSREEVAMPATGRDRLLLTIVPAEEQMTAGQADLLATAMDAALAIQKEHKAPVLVVNLLSQQGPSSLASPLLAQAVYIPDGKGFDGNGSDEPAWESALAAKRGFLPEELQYLSLWAEQYMDYQGPSGTKEVELDAAISAIMGIPAGSLRPFANQPGPAPIPR